MNKYNRYVLFADLFSNQPFLENSTEVQHNCVFLDLNPEERHDYSIAYSWDSKKIF